MYFNGRKNIIVGLCVFSMIAPLGSGFASAYNATDSQKKDLNGRRVWNI